MKTRIFTLSGLALVLMLALASVAPAKDAIKASVVPVAPPTPIVQQNGNPYSAGTFAVGTIQLFYTVNAYQFTAGNFASFNLNLQDVNYGTTPAAVYPAVLSLHQIGSKDLTLTPATSSFALSAVGWTGSTLVTISIPASVPADPSLNTDGTDLVGNLQMDTSLAAGGNPHIDTVTTVQVHIKLVHPTNCLRVFNFLTDEGFNTLVSSTTVNLGGQDGRKVVSTTPFGQFSDNILVVNTCSVPFSFDVRAVLDPSFQTNPHGNPGNAVFTFLTSGALNPSSLLTVGKSGGTAQGQSLCLHNLSVPAGYSFLMTVHMGIIRGGLPSELSASPFTFSAEIDTAGTLPAVCTSSGTLNPVATPSSLSATMSYTVQ